MKQQKSRAQKKNRQLSQQKKKLVSLNRKKMEGLSFCAHEAFIKTIPGDKKWERRPPPPQHIFLVFQFKCYLQRRTQKKNKKPFQTKIITEASCTCGTRRLFPVMADIQPLLGGSVHRRSAITASIPGNVKVFYPPNQQKKKRVKSPSQKAQYNPH